MLPGRFEWLTMHVFVPCISFRYLLLFKNWIQLEDRNAQQPKAASFAEDSEAPLPSSNPLATPIGSFPGVNLITRKFLRKGAQKGPRIFFESVKLSRQRDLNSRPTVYETVALPLSYVGTPFIIHKGLGRLGAPVETLKQLCFNCGAVNIYVSPHGACHSGDATPFAAAKSETQM
jgi:hypothetical protein